MNARKQNNFYDSMELGDKAEKELAQLFKSKMPGFVSVDKVDYKTHGFDLALTFIRDGIKFTKACEVKDLAGGYDTGVVEVWANDNKTRRPHWWKMGGCDYIFFKDESRNLWFMYNANEVIKFLENYTGYQFRAYNGNEDDSGWLAKFYWDRTNLPKNHNNQYVMDGWIATFKGLEK